MTHTRYIIEAILNKSNKLDLYLIEALTEDIDSLKFSRFLPFIKSMWWRMRQAYLFSKVLGYKFKANDVFMRMLHTKWIIYNTEIRINA